MPSVADPRRPAWAAIDLNAVGHNVAELRRVAAPAAVWVVVKADGYGHGAVEVARAALEAGAEGLCVALVSEAAVLRGAGIDAPVLLLSEPPLELIPQAIGLGLQLTVYRREAVDAISRAGQALVHLKVDTGMHRVGASPTEVGDLAEAIVARRGLTLAGVWTHFALADVPSDATTEHQIEVFAEATAALPREVRRHLANSAGALAHPAARGDLVRCGLAAYGLWPSKAVADLSDARLRPALSLKARVSFVRRYPMGTRVSYGLRRALARDSNVATVPIGYADGVPRRLFDVGGEVLVGGTRCPLAGVVTMDQLMVDCGDMAVAVDDEVVLIGKQGDAEITATEWADKLGTISYEVTCSISSRVPRHHHQ